MKKQIFLTLLCTAFFPVLAFAQSTNPQADNGWIALGQKCTTTNALDVTTLQWEKQFPKKEWKFKLCLKRLEDVRTFQSIDKMVTRGWWQSCTIQYTVNGSAWNPSHEHWNTNKEYEPQLRARISTRNECGYTSDTPNPNSTHKKWKVFSKIYWYDETPPVCGKAEFYDAKEGGNQITYKGWWINKKIYVQFKCDDQNRAWCVDGKDFSERNQIIYGNDYVSVTFGDKVENKITHQCKLGKDFPLYKYDPTDPENKIVVTDAVWVKGATNKTNNPLDNNPANSKDITDPDNISLFAGEKEFHVTITDNKLPYANGEGISGVKKINITSTPDTNPNASVCHFAKRENIDENKDVDKPSVEQFSAKCDYTKKGKYTFTLTYEDQAGNKVEKTKNITVVPNNDISFVIDKVKKSPDSGVFANNDDSFTFRMHVEDSHGNRIHNKNFIFTNPSDIPLIQGNPNNGNALTTTINSTRLTTNNNGEIGDITIKSYAPGELLTNNFKIQFPKWNEKYIDIGESRLIKLKGNEEKYHFLPLFKASMNLIGDTSIVFGQKQKLQFIFTENAASRSKPQGTKTDAFHSSTTENKSEWKMTYSGSVQNDISSNKTIEREFIPEQIAPRITQDPNIIAKPRVSYTIDNKYVSYNVGKDYTFPVDPLTLSGWEINKIFIGGQEQAQGKQEFVSDTSKLGNNSWVTARNAITRQVAELTRNRQPDGSVIHHVKYVSGDQDLSGEVNGAYKTLIVEDGNVTFSNNFNTNKENIAIILINKTNKEKSRIFIKPKVTFISALIFAENSIESVDDKGNTFAESNSYRTRTLSKQIVFHGGLYTRNTIGGAVAGTTGKYVLPGNVETTNIHDAVRYDLSFLRMKAGGKDDASQKQFNQGRTESVVVWPNIKGLTNPPPGFRLK